MFRVKVVVLFVSRLDLPSIGNLHSRPRTIWMRIRECRKTDFVVDHRHIKLGIFGKIGITGI